MVKISPLNDRASRLVFLQASWHLPPWLCSAPQPEGLPSTLSAKMAAPPAG